MRSQNVKLTLHLFSCPFAPSHHSFLISDTLFGFRSVNISPNSHLDRGKQRRDYGVAQNSPFCCLCRTAYSVRYRQVSKAAPSSHFYPECCPGWRRLHSHHCNQGNQTRGITVLCISKSEYLSKCVTIEISLAAICVKPCVNGGTCVRPNLCACPLGWKGYQCQTGKRTGARLPAQPQECL